jgi:hypothetical protein
MQALLRLYIQVPLLLLVSAKLSGSFKALSQALLRLYI